MDHYHFYFSTVNWKCTVAVEWWKDFTKIFCISAVDQSFFLFFLLLHVVYRCFCKASVPHEFVLRLKKWLFFSKVNWITLFDFPPLSVWVGVEAPGLKGCSYRICQDVLKDTLCCSNSFFGCSLDGQDVLNLCYELDASIKSLKSENLFQTFNPALFVQKEFTAVISKYLYRCTSFHCSQLLYNPNKTNPLWSTDQFITVQKPFNKNIDRARKPTDWIKFS